MTRSRAVPLRAVTFDFWNTLIRADDTGVRRRRLAAWQDLLAGEGVQVDEQRVVGAIRHAGERFDASWKVNRIYRADDAVRDMIDHLGVAVSEPVRAGLLVSMTDPDPADYPGPTPNVRAALDALRDAGVRLGIICDVGLTPSTTLRRYLDHHGLLGHFDHASFSDEVGSYKPSAAIFDHALDGLGGIDPAQSAHVGDLRRTDVAGALARGIFAVRYAGVYDDPGSAEDGSDAVVADAVVDDHADLAGTLGLA